MLRWWRVTVEKTVIEMDYEKPVMTITYVRAHTAQEATRGLTDLTTLNGRVFRFEVAEVPSKPFEELADE